jgi:UPF0716 protein FxsA
MWLLLAFLCLPLIEIALFVVIGGAIGLWPTLAWVILSVVIGILILKRVARLGPISFDRDVRSLRDPRSPVAGRALTILAAGLLILPGFFTDGVGLLLLFPPVQAFLVHLFTRRFRQSETVRQGDMTIDGSWTEVPPTPETQGTSPDAAPPNSGWTRH